MVQSDKQISISRELSKKLFPLTLSICLVIAVIFPGAYCYFEFNRLKKETGLYSRQLADSIRQLAAGSPGLWKYQATKYAEIIDGFVPNKGILSIAVLDDQSNPINQFSHSETPLGLFRQFGISGEPGQILFNNRKIGEIRIRLAADIFLVKALIVLMTCLVSGAGLSLLVYKMPLGVVTRLEQRVLDRTRELESRIGNVAKVADLIAGSGDGLGRFLVDDPRGRRIPAYLTSLLSALKEEQQLILREAETLTQRIGHIKEIVTMQQAYGRVSGVLPFHPNN